MRSGDKVAILIEEASPLWVWDVAPMGFCMAAENVSPRRRHGTVHLVGVCGDSPISLDSRVGDGTGGALNASVDSFPMVTRFA